MNDTDNLPALLDHYNVQTTRVRAGSGNRHDWHAHRTGDLVSATEADDFVEALRTFFNRIDTEVDQYRDDPIALAQALARMEAILADIRSVRDTLNRATAEAMSAHGVRRLVVDTIVSLEASSVTEGEKWDTGRCLTDVLRRVARNVDDETGEIGEPHFDVELIASVVVSVAAISYFRKTALHGMGLNPDDYIDTPRDEDGRPLRKPTVRIWDNAVRSRG